MGEKASWRKSGFSKVIRSPWFWGPVIPLGLGLLLVSFIAGEKPGSMDEDVDLYAWAWITLVIGIVTFVLGAIGQGEWGKRRRVSRGDRQEMITQLTKSLKEALQTIEAISAEIEDRERVLSQIENELAARKHVAQLTKEETAAVDYMLEKALHRERRPTMLREFVFAVGGFIFGWVATNGVPDWFPG